MQRKLRFHGSNACSLLVNLAEARIVIPHSSARISIAFLGSSAFKLQNRIKNVL